MSFSEAPEILFWKASEGVTGIFPPTRPKRRSKDSWTDSGMGNEVFSFMQVCKRSSNWWLQQRRNENMIGVGFSDHRNGNRNKHAQNERKRKKGNIQEMSTVLWVIVMHGIRITKTQQNNKTNTLRSARALSRDSSIEAIYMARVALIWLWLHILEMHILRGKRKRK